MDHLYLLRSQFLHQGEDQIKESDISIISYIAFAVIVELISWNDKIEELAN
jgi:hypothetical protein